MSMEGGREPTEEERGPKTERTERVNGRGEDRRTREDEEEGGEEAEQGGSRTNFANVPRVNEIK
jgi:hypothetical protein